MNKLIFYSLIGMVFLASCKRNTSLLSSEKEKLEIIDPEFKYLTSKAKFKFDHEDKKVSATANFRIRKDSIIWVSITPGLGLEVARVLVDRNHVYVINKLEREYSEYNFEELSKEYGFDFSFDLIQSVILGNLSEPYRDQKLEKTDSYFSYQSQKGRFNFNNFIGTKSHKLEKVQVLDDSTKNTISVNYRDFVLVDQEIFPNEISAVIDYDSELRPNTEIDISYNKLTIEPIPLSFPFKVPSRYGRK
ncbi:MAG: DUF4292 domain-containing protein [Cyclobacteriaceae bacterium]